MNFKIRKGWPVGCKVTLRSNKMYEFLERDVSIALPRTRFLEGSLISHSMVVIIIAGVKSKSFSPKLTTIKLNQYVEL